MAHALLTPPPVVPRGRYAHAEDVAHALLQLCCAAYCARVLIERTGLIPPHSNPLDLATGSGLALHTALGLVTWGVGSAIGSAALGVQDHYAAWRWSAAAIEFDPRVPVTRPPAGRESRNWRARAMRAARDVVHGVLDIF